MAIAEWLNLKRWLDLFPVGILSVVSDTFDLFRVITEILPRLKDKIMSRDGKLVVRPDSGDPVDITCGLNAVINFSSDVKNEPTSKGVIELLWDIFGGTVNKQGFKVLDPHIGAIYGDSINLVRQVRIYERLASKGFAATNIVLGIGSFTYQFNTRDTNGYAAKGAQFEANGKSFEIYKDPVTDDGTKKSLKGFCQVINNRLDARPDEIFYDGKDQIEVRIGCTKEEEDGGLLQVIYENGKFFNQVTLDEVRDRVRKLSMVF